MLCSAYNFVCPSDHCRQVHAINTGEAGTCTTGASAAMLCKATCVAACWPCQHLVLSHACVNLSFLSVLSFSFLSCSCAAADQDPGEAAIVGCQVPARQLGHPSRLEDLQHPLQQQGGLEDL